MGTSGWPSGASHAHTEIDVPEIPGGRSDVPPDLGTIDLKSSRPPGVE
jgi:hypothetical protein